MWQIWSSSRGSGKKLKISKIFHSKIMLYVQKYQNFRIFSLVWEKSFAQPSVWYHIFLSENANYIQYYFCLEACSLYSFRSKDICIWKFRSPKLGPQNWGQKNKRIRSTATERMRYMPLHHPQGTYDCPRTFVKKDSMAKNGYSEFHANLWIKKKNENSEIRV